MGIQSNINSIISSLAGTAKLAKIAANLEVDDLVNPTQVQGQEIQKDELTKQNVIPSKKAVDNSKKRLKNIIEAREQSYQYLQAKGRVKELEKKLKDTKAKMKGE